MRVGVEGAGGSKQVYGRDWRRIGEPRTYEGDGGGQRVKEGRRTEEEEETRMQVYTGEELRE